MDGDLTTGEYHALRARADVLLAPSRWEGLGLHLYEACALGTPTITIDRAPMNEVVLHEHNGLLVGSHEVEPPTPSGVAAYDPDIDALAAAIERCRAPELRTRLAMGSRRRARELAWELTVADLASLKYLGASTGAPSR